MRKVKVTVSFCGKSFESTYEVDEHVQEYQISDEAYRLAMLFAETQVIARYGHMVSVHKFADMLKFLDYEYSIEEKNNG